MKKIYCEYLEDYSAPNTFIGSLRQEGVEVEITAAIINEEDSVLLAQFLEDITRLNEEEAAITAHYQNKRRV